MILYIRATAKNSYSYSFMLLLSFVCTRSNISIKPSKIMYTEVIAASRMVGLQAWRPLPEEGLEGHTYRLGSYLKDGVVREGRGQAQACKSDDVDTVVVQSVWSLIKS